MTVIAGVNLFNGVMLLADSRLTVSQRGRRQHHCDIAQKILPLTPSFALAFSGDVSLAAFFTTKILQGIRARKRTDPISLMAWLPRFCLALSREHTRLRGAYPRKNLELLVAGALQDHRTIVARERVAELVRSIISSEGTLQRNYLPDIVMRILMAPAEYSHVEIPGTVRGIVASMKYPGFTPQYVPPLMFTALGSGQSSSASIAKMADWIFADHPGNDMVESFGLREAVGQFVASQGIDSVGGMYPCVKIDQRGISMLGMEYHFPPSHHVTLGFDPNRRRWIQTNVVTGKVIPLLLPWEITPESIGSRRTFDDLQEAIENFNPLRARPKARH